MTKHCRRWNDIVSSEKQVGVTQPRGLHVDEDFGSHRRGDVHFLKIESSIECVKYKCLHLGLLSRLERFCPHFADDLHTGWNYLGETEPTLL